MNLPIKHSKLDATKIGTRVVFLPTLWMNWSMHMDFLTHYIWIQTCLIRSGYIIDGSGHIAYKTEHSVQWAKFWSAFHLSTPRQKIVQVDWLILNNTDKAILHMCELATDPFKFHSWYTYIKFDLITIKGILNLIKSIPTTVKSIWTAVCECLFAVQCEWSCSIIKVLMWSIIYRRTIYN